MRLETVGQWLTARFGLKRPRARSYWGLLTRIAAKVAAFNLGVYINHLYGRPTFAFFEPVRIMCISNVLGAPTARRSAQPCIAGPLPNSSSL